MTLTLGYGSFGHAVGGDWAGRLRLVRLPDCALSTPQNPACRVITPVASVNDTEHQTVTADVTVPPDAGVFALTAATSGSTGDYSASPLAPSSAWQVNEQAGSFGWAYPLPVPPGIGGPEPQLAIGYDSGSVDGRTSSTNNQPSWVGEGHQLGGGFIERRYSACRDDRDGDNSVAETGDLCWHSDNAVMSFGGRSGDLIRDTADPSKWRLEDDDGSRIERLTGGFNSDDNGEYWRVTTSDGVQYYFGTGKRPGGDGPGTNSAWTVPVFGNHPGEPCHVATYRNSWCQQGWRWNLDYVVDPHGNSMTYFYAAESNNYGRNLNEAVSAYTRGGYLTRIEYGQHSGSEHTTAPPPKPWRHEL